MESSRALCLVIEDDPDICGLLCLILASEGFEVHAEATGMGGLDAAVRLNPAIITLDLGLPDVDGRDIARSIRKHSNVPLLMITARAGADDELEGMAVGATAYLTKPFRPAQLRELVQQLCPRSALGPPPAHA